MKLIYSLVILFVSVILLQCKNSSRGGQNLSNKTINPTKMVMFYDSLFKEKKNIDVYVKVLNNNGLIKIENGKWPSDIETIFNVLFYENKIRVYKDTLYRKRRF
jgi:hypothetical protein